VTENARSILARAIADLDIVAALLPALSTHETATRAKARLKATAAELAVLRARLSEPPIAGRHS